MDHRELVSLGLAEKEAKIYLAALELGKTTVLKIAEKSKVNRATSYIAIETLMQKGLMSSVDEGKKQYFFAESPEKLSLLFREEAMAIQRKQEYLDKLMPELKSINNLDKEKPVVRYFEGKAGVRAMVEDMFNAKSGEEILMTYNADLIEKTFDRSELDDWAEKRIKKGVHVKGIYAKKDVANIRRRENTVLKHVSSDEYNIKSDIAVYEDKIRIASLEKRLIGIIIEDKEAAETLRVLIRLAWDGLNKKSC